MFSIFSTAVVRHLLANLEDVLLHLELESTLLLPLPLLLLLLLFLFFFLSFQNRTSPILLQRKMAFLLHFTSGALQ